MLDRKYGTNFLGGENGRLKQNELGIPVQRANDYSGSPRNIIKTLKRYSIGRNDSIIDVGCGMGLAMWYMSQFPFGKIAGIELSENLLNTAKANLSIMEEKTGRKTHYVFFHGDAGKWDGYAEFNYFYIYNSLPRVVMEEFVAELENSLKMKERKVVILYLMPEFPEVLMCNNNFQLVSKGKKCEIRNGMWVFEHCKQVCLE